MKKTASSYSRLRTSSALLLVISLAVPSIVRAAPQNGAFAAGTGAITTTSPTRTVIQQNSDRAIINWQDFSIGQQESVEFRQPSSNSFILNRVSGENPSRIDGHLRANGNVAILNKNGVLFGQGATVDVGGLIATTSEVDNSDFMAGRLHFKPSGSTASVRNDGRITAQDAGLVALVAPTVVNSGVIASRLGKVVLAAGEAYTLDLYGDTLFSFAVPAGEAGIKSVLQSADGKISADGGQVLITAHQAKDIVDQAINLDGVIQARSVREQNGKITLDGNAGSVAVAGLVDVSGREGDQTGGKATVLGKSITLAATSRIDAAGQTGGGTVLVGGNKKGQGPEPHAETLDMRKGATIDARALADGDGGEVILWSDQKTVFSGMIAVDGGAVSGKGGFAETSSKKVLESTGNVSMVSVDGRHGEWLIDPENIIIDWSYNCLDGDSTFSTCKAFVDEGAPGNYTFVATNNITWRHRGGNSNFHYRLVLIGNTNVTLKAGNNIYLNDFVFSNFESLSFAFEAGNMIYGSIGQFVLRCNDGSICVSHKPLNYRLKAKNIDVYLEPGGGYINASATESINLRIGGDKKASDNWGDIILDAPTIALRGARRPFNNFDAYNRGSDSPSWEGIKANNVSITATESPVGNPIDRAKNFIGGTITFNTPQPPSPPVNPPPATPPVNPPSAETPPASEPPAPLDNRIKDILRREQMILDQAEAFFIAFTSPAPSDPEFVEKRIEEIFDGVTIGLGINSTDTFTKEAEKEYNIRRYQEILIEELSRQQISDLKEIDRANTPSSS
jgi:filamentous hemagglutinin family protein